MYVTPTELKPYLLGDPLVSWLKHYHPELATPDTYKQYLCNLGITFEKEVISTLSQTHTILTIPHNEDRFNMTKQAIQQKVPIIYCAYLSSTQLQGTADLLVHTDYLPKLVSTPLPKDYTGYVVIDIKLSTLPLKANGTTLLNSEDIPFYKGQLWCYTKLVGELQNKTCPYAFLLGKKWKYTTKKTTYKGTWKERWGLVDFTTEPEIATQTERAITWMQKVKAEGSSWCLSPPSVPELYPNMSVVDTEWQTTKKTLALQVGELTYLWQCGRKEREHAWNNGIFSFYDNRCTSSTLGLSGKRGEILDKMLEVNRQTLYPLLPRQFKTNWWRTHKKEAFLDFETVVMEEGVYIFMAGVGWVEQGHYQYRSWVLTHTTRDEEKLMLTQLSGFLAEFERVWYWYADKGIYESGLVRNGLTLKPKFEWVDLAQLFQHEPIVINGCYSFGLKEVVSALNKHGLLSTVLEGDCVSGLAASHQAMEVYTGVRGVEILSSILKYNQFDVKVLADLLEMLRNWNGF